jgi:hypothetical protein
MKDLKREYIYKGGGKGGAVLSHQKKKTVVRTPTISQCHRFLLFAFAVWCVSFFWPDVTKHFQRWSTHTHIYNTHIKDYNKS